MTKLMETLAADYPQLYLNPDTDSREAYRRVVLRGEEPEAKSLAHYRGDPADREEIADTPAGQVRVVTLGNRQDFELALRSLMAAKDGPLTPIPASQGAAMLTLFNWPRIHAHLARFPEEERAAEFKRFTAGHSDTIRRYHELTHVICRRLYPGDVAPIRDELVADAVGLTAAYGRFDPETEKRFLGIRDGRYVGGRLGNYTDTPEALTGAVCAALERIRATVEKQAGTEPFRLIPALMREADIGETKTQTRRNTP